MPFESKRQAKKCFAMKARNQAGSWNCHEWAKHTDYSKLPEKKTKKAEAALGVAQRKVPNLRTPIATKPMAGMNRLGLQPSPMKPVAKSVMQLTLPGALQEQPVPPPPVKLSAWFESLLASAADLPRHSTSQPPMQNRAGLDKAGQSAVASPTNSINDYTISPFARGFLLKCAMLNLTEDETMAALEKAATVHPAVAEELRGITKEAFGWAGLGAAAKGAIPAAGRAIWGAGKGLGNKMWQGAKRLPGFAFNLGTTGTVAYGAGKFGGQQFGADTLDALASGDPRVQAYMQEMLNSPGIQQQIQQQIANIPGAKPLLGVGKMIEQFQGMSPMQKMLIGGGSALGLIGMGKLLFGGGGGQGGNSNWLLPLGLGAGALGAGLYAPQIKQWWQGLGQPNTPPPAAIPSTPPPMANEFPGAQSWRGFPYPLPDPLTAQSFGPAARLPMGQPAGQPVIPPQR